MPMPGLEAAAEPQWPCAKTLRNGQASVSAQAVAYSPGECGAGGQHSTKPGQMAGLRCLRDLPLAEASDQVALTLSCLLP